MQPRCTVVAILHASDWTDTSKCLRLKRADPLTLPRQKFCDLSQVHCRWPLLALALQAVLITVSAQSSAISSHETPGPSDSLSTSGTSASQAVAPAPSIATRNINASAPGSPAPQPAGFPQVSQPVLWSLISLRSTCISCYYGPDQSIYCVIWGAGRSAYRTIRMIPRLPSPYLSTAASWLCYQTASPVRPCRPAARSCTALHSNRFGWKVLCAYA